MSQANPAKIIFLACIIQALIILPEYKVRAEPNQPINQLAGKLTKENKSQQNFLANIFLFIQANNWEISQQTVAQFSLSVIEKLSPFSLDYLREAERIIILESYETLEQFDIEFPAEEFLDRFPAVPEAEISETEEREILDKILNTAMDINVSKYPYIFNTTDNLTIEPTSYKPFKYNATANFNFKTDRKISNNEPEKEYSPLFRDWQFSYYPESQQFFWILENNTLVFESGGWHYNSNYQGQSTQIKRQQTAKVATNFWGVQTAWALPSDLSDLIGKRDDVRISLITGEITSPQINSSSELTLEIDPSVVPGDTIILFDEPGKGDTYSRLGGGSSFSNLDADNAPLFLQGFPTVNLQELVKNGVPLEAGTVIPPQNLKAAGIKWGDFFTGQGFEFKQDFSSLPGVKTLRLDVLPLAKERPNPDLVSILSNPFLEQREKDFHYLNSLWWNNFGQNSAQLSDILEIERDSKDWYRFTLTFSHNRTQLHYDPEEIQLTYTNIFANPGMSITSTLDVDVDTEQTTVGTIGTLLGALFWLIDQNEINANLSAARERYKNLQPLSSLQTKATRQERRQMNIRLNHDLSEANKATGLSQVSGNWTVNSKTTPHTGILWQVKTGLHRRGVQFFNISSKWGTVSPTYLTYVRNNDFGPLTYSGLNFPINKTDIEPFGTTSATYVILTFDDISYVRELNKFNRPTFTTVPLPTADNAFDIEFGLLELARFSTRTIKENSYIGYLYLPAVEGVMAGSIDDFHYAVGVGMWYNPYPDSAPQLKENQAADFNIAGLSSEPDFGVYLNARAKYIFRDTIYNQAAQPVLNLAHIPAISFDWNSSANRLNISALNLSYTFLLRHRDFNFFSSNILKYTPEMFNAGTSNNSQGDLIFTNVGSLQTSEKKLAASYSLEIGKNIFYGSNITYRFLEDKDFGSLALGAYYRNFTNLSRGLNTRIEDTAYGMILKYLHPNQTFYLNAEIGTNEEGFEANVSTGVKFNF